MTAMAELAPTQPSRPPRSPVRRRQNRAWSGPLMTLVPLIVMALFVIYPLLYVLSNAIKNTDGSYGLQAWSDLFGNPVFRDVIWTTVRIAVIATAISLVVGAFLATVMVFVPFRGVSLVINAINVYLSFPSFLVTLALVFVWGNVGIVNGALHGISSSAPTITLLDGQWGVIMAEVIFFTPFVIQPLVGAYQSMDLTQVEMASALGAKPFRIVRTVILPEAMPTLLAGGSLVLMRTMNEFGIILFSGAKDVVTLPTLVYSQAVARGNYTYAAIAAAVNIALSVLLYACYRVVAARTIGGRNARS